jgi:hypothetical protein
MTSSSSGAELALNYADGKLFYKDSGGVVQLLASKATSINVSSFSAGTTGFTPNTATTGAVTLAGTLATTNGGTGLISFTSGGALYATSTSALTTGTLPTASGGTALTSFTSGGAMYATSTSVLTTGTLPVTAGGTGLTTLTAGYIPFGAGTSAFGNSANLFWDSANTALGIGTATPNTWTARLTIVGGTNQIAFGDSSISSTNYALLNYSGGTGALSLTANSTGGGTLITFNTSNSATATEKMRLNGLGQLFINGTSGTSLLTIASSTVYPALKVPNIVETANTVAGAPASTQTFYMNLGAVQYYTSNAANNWTVNFAMSSGTSLNTAMAIGDSMSCTMLTTQSTTAYYNSAVQIDGVSVTPKWQNGTAPTSGNASGIDSYTYVIYKTASATYTVLASQTKFA